MCKDCNQTTAADKEAVEVAYYNRLNEQEKADAWREQIEQRLRALEARPVPSTYNPWEPIGPRPRHFDLGPARR